jgi:hypothetical protein
MKTETINSLFETLLWSSSDGDDYLDDYSNEDILKEDAKNLQDKFEDFYSSNAELINSEDQDLSQIAHDFILTCNGHGAGFWDGDYNEGDKLTELCKPYGSFDTYVTDDNKIGIMN